MTYSIQITNADILSDELLNEVKASCQRAMATAFKITAQHNLGFPPGEDRPETWADLSNSPMGKRYQKKVGRKVATLYETGALHDSIVVDETAQPEFASVVCQSEYGYDHQFGNSATNLPARPFFPMLDDELTNYTAAKCLEAAQDALVETLNKH